MSGIFKHLHGCIFIPEIGWHHGVTPRPFHGFFPWQRRGVFVFVLSKGTHKMIRLQLEPPDELVFIMCSESVAECQWLKTLIRQTIALGSSEYPTGMYFIKAFEIKGYYAFVGSLRRPKKLDDRVMSQAKDRALIQLGQNIFKHLTNAMNIYLLPT